MDIMLVGGLSPMMNRLCLKLHKEGHRLYVLSGSRNPGNHYTHVYEQYNFPYDNFHGVRYGTKKSSAITHKNAEVAILFDDNAEVRESWSIGETVDPTTTDIIDFLKNLLTNNS